MPLEMTTIFFSVLCCTSGRKARTVFRTPKTLMSKLFCVSLMIESRSCSLYHSQRELKRNSEREHLQVLKRLKRRRLADVGCVVDEDIQAMMAKDGFGLLCCTFQGRLICDVGLDQMDVGDAISGESVLGCLLVPYEPKNCIV